MPYPFHGQQMTFCTCLCLYPCLEPWSSQDSCLCHRHHCRFCQSYRWHSRFCQMYRGEAVPVSSLFFLSPHFSLLYPVAVTNPRGSLIPVHVIGTRSHWAQPKVMTETPCGSSGVAPPPYSFVILSLPPFWHSSLGCHSLLHFLYTFVPPPSVLLVITTPACHQV